MTTRRFHDLSSFHRDLIKLSGAAICFHCGGQSNFDDIEEWIDENTTAICPLCGIDSLIPITSTPQLMQAMHKEFFNEDLVTGPEPESAEDKSIFLELYPTIYRLEARHKKGLALAIAFNMIRRLAARDMSWDKIHGVIKAHFDHQKNFKPPEVH